MQLVIEKIRTQTLRELNETMVFENINQNYIRSQTTTNLLESVQKL